MAPLTHHFLNFVKTALATAAAVGSRYVMLAGVAWLLAYLLFRRRWFHRKIIATLPHSSEVWREIRYSALTLLVFGAVGAGTFQLARAGGTQLYHPLLKHGWGGLLLSVAAAILLHDAYFYWTHRLMHHRRLFRHFHRVHHLSRNPTPWAAYAFAPLEAVVEAAIFPLAIVLIPMHPLAFAIFMGWQITFNILGHTGYEFHPRWLMDSFLGRILNTPTNHVMHHETLRGNYGLYFNLWDRWMGTNQADYESRFRAVTSRPAHRRAPPDRSPLPTPAALAK